MSVSAALAQRGVRLAAAEDLEAIVDCVRAAYTVYVPRMGREPAPMGADYAELIGRGVVYVLPGPEGEGGSVRGVLVAYPLEGAFFIENVAVQPRYQGQGLGRRLLELAEALARAAGFSELRLYTNELMTENLALYAHLGFAEYARGEEHGFHRVYLRKAVD